MALRISSQREENSCLAALSVVDLTYRVALAATTRPTANTIQAAYRVRYVG
jgi:hypothetical protein